ARAVDAAAGARVELVGAGLPTALGDDRAGAVLPLLLPLAAADLDALLGLDHLDPVLGPALGLVLDHLPGAGDRDLAGVLLGHRPTNGVRDGHLVALGHRPLDAVPLLPAVRLVDRL